MANPHAFNFGDIPYKFQEILAYITKEYGHANEDWSMAEIRIPYSVWVDSWPSAINVIRDGNNDDMVISVPLPQIKEDR